MSNSPSTDRARSARPRANARSRSSRLTPAARPSTSPGGRTRPVRPSCRMSEVPSTEVATIGTPEAIASGRTQLAVAGDEKSRARNVPEDARRHLDEGERRLLRLQAGDHADERGARRQTELLAQPLPARARTGASGRVLEFTQRDAAPNQA